MQLSVDEIAKKLGAEVKGNQSALIHGLRPLERAGQGDLSFFAPTSRKQTKQLFDLAKNSTVEALLVRDFEPAFPATQIRMANPIAGIIALAPLFSPLRRPESGIHPTAVIDPSSTIGEGTSVGAYVVIGPDVSVGKNVILHPHVVVYQGAQIGDESEVHSGAVIREFVCVGKDCLILNGAVLGGDGFGYIPDKDLGHRRIPHIGALDLGDRVDVGANSTVDRGMLGTTEIGESSKLDNLVMVGHNTRIGKRSLFCSGVGISGSCTIGDDVVLAGQVGVADHCQIGNRVRAMAQAGLWGSFEPNQDIGGNPGMPARNWNRIKGALNRLPELLKRVKRLEDRLQMDE